MREIEEAQREFAKILKKYGDRADGEYNEYSIGPNGRLTHVKVTISRREPALRCCLRWFMRHILSFLRRSPS